MKGVRGKIFVYRQWMLDGLDAYADGPSSTINYEVANRVMIPCNLTLNRRMVSRLRMAILRTPRDS